MKLPRKIPDLSTKSLVGLGLFSAVSTVLDATALITLVPLASTIASGKDEFRGRILGVSLRPSVSVLLLVTVGLVVSRGLAGVLTGRQIARIGSEYEAGKRQRLFAAFVDSDWDLQSKELSGHLLETMTSAVQRTTSAVGSLCGGLVSVISLFMLTAFALVVSPPFSVAIVVAIVGLFFAVRPISKLAFRYSRQQRAINFNYAHNVSQATSMAKEIKVFDARDAVREENQRLVSANRRNRYRQLFLADLVPNVYQSLALLGVVLGLAVVWWLEVAELTSLAAIVLLLVRALTQSQGLQGTYHKLVDARPFFELLKDRLEIMDAARQSSGGVELTTIESIGFSQVSFSYLSGETVLHDVSFETRRGEAIGVVGPSGAGKSTFVQLLLRLRRPDSGAVLVNGRPAEEFSLSSWFGRIGFVPQEPVLLDASVADNIRFYRPGVTQEAIVRAARLAHVHDEIMSWPKGYDTPVGDRGGEVSGGQRQRLCIARALLLEPDIIILDEPTSSLDAHSEAQIQQTMQELHGQVTLFIVAHRLTTLNICDRIMVFREGVLQAFAERQQLAQENVYYSDALRLSRLP